MAGMKGMPGNTITPPGIEIDTAGHVEPSAIGQWHARLEAKSPDRGVLHKRCVERSGVNGNGASSTLLCYSRCQFGIACGQHGQYAQWRSQGVDLASSVQIGRYQARKSSI